MVKEEPLITTSVAARLAVVSDNTIRGWANRGLLPALRTSTGLRLYRRTDVLRAKAAREETADPDFVGLAEVAEVANARRY